MQPLFGNTATANDPRYNFIRGDPGKTANVAKKFTESLWAKYHPYADCNFRKEIRGCFDARFWEMYLACTLMDKGIRITQKTKKNTGPDVRVEHKGNIIWIEAIVPTSGDKSKKDSVPELVITNPPTVQKVPDEQIILRYRAAIKMKYNDQYFKYLDRIINEKDFYIIAINGCQVPCSKVDFDPPRILRSVLPFGYQQIPLDKDPKQGVSKGFQYRAEISKTSGSPVRTDIFLDPDYKHINAILFSNVDVFNLTNCMGEDFIIVHNPLARTLPDDFLNFGQHWKAELRKDELTAWRVSPKG